MKFQVTLRIGPPGDFGLPEEDTTVIPGSIGTFHGPSVDTATGQLVGHGTLPIYRNEPDRIDMALSLPRTELQVTDNNAFCTVDAETHTEALRLVMEEIGKLLRLLSARRGIFYSAYPLSIVDSELKPYRVPNPIKFGSFRVYNLPTLKSDLADVAKTTVILDSRLQKAILYMQNALLMMEFFHGKPIPITTTDFNVVSLVVLELWKACTSIVGDPSVKKDRFQKRYKEIGIDAETKEKVDRLNRLRNDYDVAHYSLAVEKKQLLEDELPFAIITTKTVIAAYEDYLRAARGGNHSIEGAT